MYIHCNYMLLYMYKVFYLSILFKFTRKMFITLVWNDQQAFYLYHFHIHVQLHVQGIILPVVFFVYVTITVITSLLSDSTCIIMY